MRTTRSRRRSLPCWNLAALDDHTLRDIALTRLDARIRTRRIFGPPVIRIGTGMLLSAVPARIGRLAA